MKIIELLINELDKLTGVDAVALVEEPAIEADFFAFNKEEENVEERILLSLIENAIQEQFIDKKPGETKEEYVSRCVPVLESEGYEKDQALAICYDSFALLPNKENKKFSFALDEDQQMVVGPLMIPDKLILRRDENGEPYHVFFSRDTIKEIAQKVMKNKLIDKLNVEHDPDKPVDGYMVSTWLIEDPLKDKQQVYGFNFGEGTWMGQYKIEDMSVWKRIKAGEIKGFSVEGFFSDKFIQAKEVK